MKVILGALLGLMLAGATWADSVWTYDGNTMTGCNCSLDGSFTVAADNSAVSWDFTDGTHELTQANSKVGFFEPVLANGLSPFKEWAVQIIGNDGWMLHSVFYGSGFEATDFSFNIDTQTGFGYLQGDRGTWSDPASTPEPATGLLVGVGLLIAGLLRRGSKKPVDSAVWEKLA
jgi:hypothetical protein